MLVQQLTALGQTAEVWQGQVAQYQLDELQTEAGEVGEESRKQVGDNQREKRMLITRLSVEFVYAAVIWRRGRWGEGTGDSGISGEVRRRQITSRGGEIIATLCSSDRQDAERL